MALHTKHPVGALPAAPPRESTTQLMLRAHMILTLFMVFTAPAFNHAFGTIGAAVVIIAISLGTIAWFVVRVRAQRTTNPFPWRRLPWIAGAYIAWAGMSLLWSNWPSATVLTWGGLVVVSFHGIAAAYLLTWRELIRVVASAMKWIMAVSLLFELYVALIVHHPILPVDTQVPMGETIWTLHPMWYWSGGYLFNLDERIQGIVGNANLLAMLCVIAMISFAIRYALHPPRRGFLIAWFALTLILFWRAGSATTWVASAAVLVMLGAVFIMRRSRRRGGWYLLFLALGISGIYFGWFARQTVFSFLDRSPDASGRRGIWAQVLERAVQHPIDGWGFSSPWVPWDPGFRDWIYDQEAIVLQAHNMWIDVFFQLGAIGFFFLLITMLAFSWRTWFFAVDRPRWDADAHRPYHPISLFPVLIATSLLVQSIAESAPMMLWGWMMIVMLAFKIKSSPVVGLGPQEYAVVPERHR